MSTLSAIVADRLTTVPLLPELQHLLQQLIAADQHWSTNRWQWHWIIPAVQTALGEPTRVIAPFVAAWTLMYAAIVRLDHLQDADPTEDAVTLPDSTAARYNLLLAYYVLAASLLDDLELLAIPPQRIHRVQRLWSDLMLLTASGQQRDLTPLAGMQDAELPAYQELARAKTGSTFALAFGGTATLLTDDPDIITACLAVGTLFGELVQYYDDVLDAARQPSTARTLPNHLDRAYPELATHGKTPHAFWAYIYPTYRAHAAQLLANLPPALRTGLLALFATAFEHPPAEPGATP